MLNYKSVRSSEPQIRSNPALRQISSHSGFQKRIETLLEPTPLPFPTFQIMKPHSQSNLENHLYYAWIRPAHLRSSWLILTPDMPLLMMDPKNPSHLCSLRIPFDKTTVDKVGPIICEGAWDAQDHILYIWDVVIWEKSVVWSSMPYKKRWSLVEQVCSQILDIGHPMSDAEVRVPEWISLKQLSTMNSLDNSYSIEFQPDKEGQRRLLFLLQNTDKTYVPTTHHERKMYANSGNQTKLNKRPNNLVNKPSRPIEEPSCKIILDESIEEPKSKPTKPHMVRPTMPIANHGISNTPKMAKLVKDNTTNLPDTYRLKGEKGTDMGLPAIRSLDINKKLREAFKSKEEVNVQVEWFEPFQKFEIRDLI